MVLYQLILQNPDTGEDFRKENGDLLPYNIKKQANWNKAKEELGKKELELISADSAIAKKPLNLFKGQLQQNLPGLTIKLKSLPLQNRLDYKQQVRFSLWNMDWLTR